METVELSNYYECDPQKGKNDSSGRYPSSHVKYSPLLKPLAWIDAVQGMIGSGAFKIKDAKYGRHVYSLEEYGFEAEKIYEEYKEYMNRYNYGIPEKIERKASFDFGV